MKYLKNNKEKLLTISYCFLISFIIIMITSKCSFLYPFNDWVDANAFFTVGKGLVHGVIPYIDIFEQKGILLYIIYALGYMISNTTFHGIFILEVISWTVALYYAFKTIKIFLSNKSAYFILPIFMMLMCTSASFVHGGSAEEFCVPLMMITLYYFMKHFKVRELSYKEIAVAGLCAGCVLLIKFTLLGFWFGFMACIFFHLFFEKKYKKAFTSCIWFLVGMFAPLLLTLIYFGVHHGIKEFIEVYFIDNMTLYGDVKLNIIKRLYKLVKGFLNATLSNGPAVFILTIGYIYAVFKLNKKTNEKIYMTLLFLFTILGIYFGLRFYQYYLFPVLIFMLISLIWIFTKIQKKIDDLVNKKRRLYLIVTCVTCILFTIIFANYRSMIFKKKDSLFQYEFRDIILKEENPTLVNMGFLDCGIYTLTNLVPTTYFFEKQNISYEKFPDNLDAFNKYIEDKETMFIVYYTRDALEILQRENEMLFKNYELIKSASQKLEKRDFNAFLFKVKEN